MASEQGLKLLEAIPDDKITAYQPYWALAAHLYKLLNRSGEARTAYSRAIGLCTDPSVRRFLEQQSNGV